MSDPSASVLAPGVALTGAVIYWANVTGRLDTISARVRALNAELRASADASPRTRSVERQVEMLRGRSRILHSGVILSVLTLMAFLASSAVIFVAPPTFTSRDHAAGALFILGLASFGLSLITTLWEMLWARRSLDEDISSSKPPGAPPA